MNPEKQNGPQAVRFLLQRLAPDQNPKVKPALTWSTSESPAP